MEAMTTIERGSMITWLIPAMRDGRVVGICICPRPKNKNKRVVDLQFLKFGHIDGSAHWSLPRSGASKVGSECPYPTASISFELFRRIVPGLAGLLKKSGHI